MSESEREPLRPSDVEPGLSWFDRFASGVAAKVAGAWFFFACVLLVVVWSPTMFLLDFNTSQLLINTSTTIVTFLLVALLQNSQSRADKAVQRKLNAIAEALVDIMENSADDSGRRDIAELQQAVGLEQRESS